MLQVLDASALRAWCAAGLEGLTAAREEIDRLNVYPVPDGDTGTNLQLTMAAVGQALAAAPVDLASTVRAMVTGSLMGARGNSGVILSQLLRGVGDVIGQLEAVGAADLRTALKAGAASAYAAVAAPVEGTLLTVAREAAEAARGTDLAEVVRSAREGAAAALARTPDLLPQLRAAGVVDAGGRGWCVMLEALERVVTGVAVVVEPPLLVPRTAGEGAREAGSAEFGYEVQYLLRDTDDDAVAALKERLARLGDSLVVVGGDGLFNVHVHVNDVGAALEAGLDAGRPFRVTVTRFADQVAHPGPRAGRAVVAVAAGPGLAELLRDAGAQVVRGGPTANPSTEELVDAVRATGAHEVVLLPNDGNAHAVARACADAVAPQVDVRVVPTRSVLQALAALAVADPARSLDDDVAAQQEAAEATRWAEVTTAVRDCATPAGPCRTGDALGLVAGEVVLVGDDTAAVAVALLDRLLAEGGELVTVVVGADGRADPLQQHVRRTHPHVETYLLDGGQPHYPYLLGVE